MFKQGKKILLGAGVLAALSFGGSALAAAGATPVTPTVQESIGIDHDQVQSGDQSTPDTGAAASGTQTASGAQGAQDTETQDGAQGAQDAETQDSTQESSGSRGRW
jgi:hypothetical protein